MKDLREKLFALSEQPTPPLQEKKEPIEIVKKAILDGLASQQDTHKLLEIAINYLADTSGDPEYRYQAIKALKSRRDIFNEYTGQYESEPSLFGRNLYKK